MAPSHPVQLRLFTCLVGLVVVSIKATSYSPLAGDQKAGSNQFVVAHLTCDSYVAQVRTHMSSRHRSIPTGEHRTSSFQHMEGALLPSAFPSSPSGVQGHPAGFGRQDLAGGDGFGAGRWAGYGGFFRPETAERVPQKEAVAGGWFEVKRKKGRSTAIWAMCLVFQLFASVHV